MRCRSLGVPFAVKNLFDVAGLTTRAGSKIERERAAGRRTTPAVARLETRRRGARRRAQHGRVRLRLHDRELARRADAQPARPAAHRRRLVGRLGRRGRRRPGAAQRSAPTPTARSACRRRCAASFGLKPTYGRLPRTGTYPFVASLDHLGPFAAHASRTSRSSTTRCRASTARDPACAERPVEPTARALAEPHRRRCASRCSAATSDEHADGPRRAPRWTRVAAALRVQRTVELPQVERAPRRGVRDHATPKAARCTSPTCARAPPTSSRCRATASSPARCCRRRGSCRRSGCGAGSRCASPSCSSEVDVLIAPATPCAAPADRHRMARRSTASACRRGRASAC